MAITKQWVVGICGEPKTKKDLAVDHCHKTNVIRGLLCGRCNPALGYLQDSPDLARRAALYLEERINGISIDREFVQAEGTADPSI